MRRVHAGGMTCLIPPFHIARSLIAGLRLTRCERAAAMVEMALVLPLFIALAMGILVYGRYFMLAHSVPQAANDGARAAIPGLERRSVVSGKSASVRVDLGGRRILKKTHKMYRIPPQGLY